ncbi:MAG: SurA N-terminal domain-containing protein [Deltaproteobacteria bacterium]|nr:SurA N-terminal domain-containing protein [Deltaproteobacteria bacterium]
MDQNRCEHCGTEIPDGDGPVCIVCKGSSGRTRFARRWFGIAGILLLSLAAAGLLVWRAQAEGWDFSWTALTGKPVATVNGEAIPRAEFRERLRVTRGMVERQYGKGLWGGEDGKGLLAELEADVLEKMIQDRLVRQEAKRLNLSVSDEQVKAAINAIGREVYGSEESFQASLKEEGISPGYLFGHIRSRLLRQEVEKAKLDEAVNSGAPLGFWLVRARQEAQISLNGTVGPFPAPARNTASCCDPGGAASSGGCGGSGSPGGEVAPELRNEAAAAALAAFRKTYPAGKAPQARVTDYGCHIQVDIEEGGKVLRSYSYQDGAVSEI